MPPRQRFMGQAEVEAISGLSAFPLAKDAPVLQFPGSGFAPPFEAKMPGEFPPGRIGGCTSDRVMLMGGALNQLLVHPTILPWEQLYRRLPEESMFSDDISPQRPFVGEMGAFKVPPSQVLILTHLRPEVYRFSGVDAGDYLPFEARALAGSIGWQFTIDQQNAGSVAFQLDPIAFQMAASQAFQPPAGNPNQPVPQSAFNIAAANRFANAAGAGLSLMPNRPRGYGAPNLPFTVYARSNQVVQVRLVVFRKITRPVAFFEYDLAGIIAPSQWIDAMNDCMKPDQGGYTGGPR